MDPNEIPAINEREGIISQLLMLANRLERLSADSAYAHRASGYRGNLLRYLERMQSGQQFLPAEALALEGAIEASFKILTAAGREIPGGEEG